MRLPIRGKDQKGQEERSNKIFPSPTKNGRAPGPEAFEQKKENLGVL